MSFTNLKQPPREPDKFIQIAIAPTTPKTWQSLVGLTQSGKIYMRNIEIQGEVEWVEVQLPDFPFL